MSLALTSGSLLNTSTASLQSDRTLGMYSEARPKVSADQTKALGQRIASYLRHRHPAKTAANVAADTGLPQSTVAKWLEGASTPSLYAGFKLADAYGPDFVAAAWPRQAGFLSNAAAAAAQEEIRAELAALQARVDRL